jgi:hypothetical protein
MTVQNNGVLAVNNIPDMFATDGAVSAGNPVAATLLSNLPGAVVSIWNPGAGFGLSLNKNESPTGAVLIAWVTPGPNWCPISLLQHFYLEDNDISIAANYCAASVSVSAQASVRTMASAALQAAALADADTSQW